MRALKSILVGIDFTAGCEAALRTAIRMAGDHRASLHVVHVIDTQIALEMEAAFTGLQESIREGLIKSARSEWSGFASRIPEASGLNLEVRIEHRVFGILHRARETSADLMVLGANSEGRPDLGLGTISTSCVRQCPTDVLIVRPGSDGPWKNIVAAVDFSETSARALERAVQLAAAVKAHVHVVHIFAAPWDKLHYRAPTSQADPKFIEQYKMLLERQLRTFVQPILDATPHVAASDVLDDVGAHRIGLVDYAQRVNADLICLGTRGRSNLRDLILGSTAEKVLLHSNSSVLAVKPDPAGP